MLKSGRVLAYSVPRHQANRIIVDSLGSSRQKGCPSFPGIQEEVLSITEGVVDISPARDAAMADVLCLPRFRFSQT